MALGAELGNAEIRVSCGDAEHNSQRRMPADAPIRHHRILTKEQPAATARLVALRMRARRARRRESDDASRHTTRPSA
jgi:hypothetical protein